MAVERSEHFGLLQELVDQVFSDTSCASRLDVIIAGEALGLPEDLEEICCLLPPGAYTRQKLCDQLNSAVSGHGWGYVYGTVE